jgi:hypothetical protein
MHSHHNRRHHLSKKQKDPEEIQIRSARSAAKRRRVMKKALFSLMSIAAVAMILAVAWAYLIDEV